VILDVPAGQRLDVGGLHRPKKNTAYLAEQVLEQDPSGKTAAGHFGEPEHLQRRQDNIGRCAADREAVRVPKRLTVEIQVTPVMVRRFSGKLHCIAPRPESRSDAKSCWNRQISASTWPTGPSCLLRVLNFRAQNGTVMVTSSTEGPER